VTVHGLVRGTQTELDEPDESVTIAESNLSASVLGSTDGEVRIHLRLEDADTGDPIALDERAGYIEIAGERHATNASGETTIRLDEPGVYTATYEPEPWLDTSTPYAGDSATVRWHPLRSLSGVFALVLRFGLVIVPLAALWYAGRQLGSMPRFGGAK